jgi:hypothetical protein
MPDFFRTTLVDAENLPETFDEHRVLLLMIKIAHNVVQKSYTAVYLHGAVAKSQRPSFWFLRNTYQLLPREFKKNLQHCFFVDASKWILLLMTLIRWVFVFRCARGMHAS